MAGIPKRPRRHHSVPILLSKRFADKNGMLHAAHTHATGGGLFTAAPRDLFIQKDWHVQRGHDGSVDVSVETLVARNIEGPAGRVIDRIVSAAEQSQPPALSASDREVWDAFFFCQRIRTPDHHEKLGLYDDFDQMIEQQILELAKRGRILPTEVAERLRRPENIARMKRNVRVQSFVRQPTLAREVMAGRGIAIVRIENESERFIIGSYPVIKLCPPETNDLRDHRVEMWLPVSSRVAVGVGANPGTEILISLTNRSHVRGINDAIARQSSIIAGESKDVVQATLRRFPWREAS
jgi:Protein of unknown function (DUF4238)